MKRIKAKASKTSEKIHSLMNGATEANVDRLLVVYGDQDASIYYEPPATTKTAIRPV